MKVDVTQNLIGLDGQPLADNDRPVNLRTVCVNALMNVLDEDKSLSGEDKLNAWTLAKRLQDEKEPDLKPEELAKLKDRVGKCYGPIVVGPACTILNNPTGGRE